MKYLIVFVATAFFSIAANAQTQAVPSKKLDSISQKVIYYLQNKQPDSIYRMTGLSFRNKITQENFNSISTSQLFPLNDFQHVKFVSYNNGINKYRVEGTPTLQLLVGLDVENKIETLLVQPYTGD